MKRVLFLIVVIALAGQVRSEGLTRREISQIETDLNIALTQGNIAELNSVVFPSNSTWRTQAYERIDQHRKADLGLRVVDMNGDPVEGAQVSIKLKSNDFKFGGIMSLKDFTDEDNALGISVQEYRDRFMAMFNSVGLDNGFKPKQRTGNEPLIPNFLTWAQTNNLPVRGHLLIWPGTPNNNHLPTELPDTPTSYTILPKVEAVETALTNGSSQATIDALKADLKAEVDYMIGDWASKWSVYEWDVINETLSNFRVQELLGYEETAGWFRIAESNVVDPDCKLLINEFQIISARSFELDDDHYTDRRDRYYESIGHVLDNGGRLDRIGFQSRVKFEVPNPQTWYDRLEEFNQQYGLPMVGTEFEVRDSDPPDTNFFPYDYTEMERAEVTESLLTAYFSHPDTIGLHAWTYMKGFDREYSMCYYDGTVKLNGLAWYYLHRIRYNTDATLSSSLNGETSLRAFKGDYEITVSYKGQDYVASLAHTNDQSIVLALPSSVVDETGDSAVIDAWHYDGLANGAGLGQGISTGIVGGVSFPAYALASVQNEAVRWQSDGTTDSMYRGKDLSSYDNASNGVFQLSVDYLDADFTASAALSNGLGRVHFSFRDSSGSDAGFRLLFSSGGGSNSYFRLEATDDLGSNQNVDSFPGMTLDHLSVRAVYDLNNRGSAGSFKVYYRYDGGAEVEAYSGQLPADFDLGQLRSVVQTYNGGCNWAEGDRISTDNLIVRKLGEAPAPLFLLDPIGKPGANQDVAYTNQTIAGTATNALAYSIVAGPSWLNVASDGSLSGTPTGADVGQNSWIVQASSGFATDTAVLKINVAGSGGGSGPGSSISIVTGPINKNDDPTTGDTVFSNISVETGDVVAIATAPNKTTAINLLSLTWTGTEGVDGASTTVNPGDNDGRTSYLFYTKIITGGSYTFTVDAADSGLTANSSLFVLRADSDTIQVADMATLSVNTSMPGLSYDFSPETLLSGGTVAIEAFASKVNAALTLDSSYTASKNANGRHVLYSTAVTGSAWSKLHTATAAGNFSGSGAVFYERTTVGSGNNPPVFSADPIVEDGAVQNLSYLGRTLADHASDADLDSMSFAKVSGPAWLNISMNGVLSGTPDAEDVGSNGWKVLVTDGMATNFANLEIEVFSSAPPVASPARDRLFPTNNYNVLFIAIDDMRPLIDAYGATEPLRPITPQMDRLAASGVMFANAHCQQAVCNASRASLLTGLRPDTTMCWKLDTHFRTPLPDIITLPQHFGAEGYRVHGIGKIYHGINPTNQDATLSWNEGWADPSTGNTWYEATKAAAEDGGNNKISATDAGEINTRDGDRPIVDADYNDGKAAELGVAKIAEYAASYHASNQPFFLGVGFQKPHLPFNAPKTYWDLYNPAEIDLTGYTGIRNMPLGSNKFTAPYGGEPSAFDDVTGTSDNGMPNATEARNLIHGYLACVSFIDMQVGKLLDALEDPDGNPNTDDSIADNTIIVLWGDHGFHLGDHNGFWAKHSNFETSTRVPLIVSMPGMDALGSAGSRSVGLVELVDVYPTLVDLCSLPSPAQPAGQQLQGTTFLPLLEDPSQPWKKAVFSQYQRNINDGTAGDSPVSSSGTGMGYSVRTERYRYTEWWVTESTDETDRHIIKAGITEPGFIELYDYVNDPGETTNLASNLSYGGLISELSALLNDSGNSISAGDGWALPETDAPTAYPIDSNVWKTNYLAPGRTMAELDFDADPDGDGITNRLEYKFGTHPFEFNAWPAESGFGAGGLYVTYPDVEARADVLLEATTTTNLTDGIWSVAGVVNANIGQKGNAVLKTGSVPVVDPVRFLRLEAVGL
ncbi:sulfatase-like hydrolase/transferase [Pontiellaceae bacterium B12227]|nr:sulfatase-like hydrolase/transferase [Pontiellaceae bacterium B12227]